MLAGVGRQKVRNNGGSERRDETLSDSGCKFSETSSGLAKLFNVSYDRLTLAEVKLVKKHFGEKREEA